MGKPSSGWVPTGNRSPHSFSDNIKPLTEQFPLSPSGYFGHKSSSGQAREIDSDDPLSTSREFAGIAAAGATHYMEIPTGVVHRLSDGTIVTERVTSSSDGTPAVTLNIASAGPVKTHKIHFKKKGA